MGSNPTYTKKRIAKITKHGHKRGSGKSPEYATWIGIKRRCYDTKYKDFPNWGGRGIKVCDRWNSSFSAFLEDMGPRPSLDHQIDRIDPDGDYEPANCRWVTARQQGAEHRRDIIPITIDGTNYPSIKAASDAFGARYSTVLQRIYAGIPAEQAVKASTQRLKPRRSRESYLPKDHPSRHIDGNACLS
jgi:hypothetical protein